ncbi:DUF742 domain-containing protein [Streptomyces yaanensis]|uniref:DUF742 domain-containing protein n=1 Tax=Streptomyces yaanensis TaxID=1142239 RepID=A0ABV7S3V9_9ACTN|nr:DUF742 domain-containing protein [Streptomyces sp. CGMCC 4.7035]WNC00633.1 DUF742 domain-containing protein [Streptomyces sp. CGMCC 4.7035]
MTDDHWYEDETGSMVRPYTVTRGRTRPSQRHTIDLMSQVTALEADEGQPSVDHARTSLLDLVRRRPRPVVELAADADLPLTVVRVLVGDLAEAGLVRIDAPRPAARGGPAADPELLREIVERLREL